MSGSTLPGQSHKTLACRYTLITTHGTLISLITDGEGVDSSPVTPPRRVVPAARRITFILMHWL